MSWEKNCNILKRQRANAKGKLSRKLTLLKDRVDRRDHLPVLKSNYVGVLQAFQCLENKFDELVNFVCKNSLDEKLRGEGSTAYFRK